MTLKEKLNDSIITNINIVESENRMCYDYNHLELAEKCEQIADEFAIDFTEWCIKNAKSTYCSGEGALIWYKKKYHTISQLLEIYKSEKEL